MIWLNRCTAIMIALMDTAQDLPFDVRPSGADLEDLDLELFRAAYLDSAISADIPSPTDQGSREKLRSLKMMAVLFGCNTLQRFTHQAMFMDFRHP